MNTTTIILIIATGCLCFFVGLLMGHRVGYWKGWDDHMDFGKGKRIGRDLSDKM
jgi:hypothetical protein